jgi:hypothetical protein
MSRIQWVLVGVILQSIAFSGFAANNRSAVSSTGLDTNPCTVAAPCRSFGAAIAVTANGGEVIALDSAGYGPFTINQDVSVSGAPGIHAAITATSGNAISVTGGVNGVYIQNLFILGGGTGAGGISDTGAFRLRVSNCFIEGFISFGIQATIGVLLVDHTLVENDGTGIDFADTNGGAVDESSVNRCSTTGIHFIWLPKRRTAGSPT